jgi:hypothetical protein
MSNNTEGMQSSNSCVRGGENCHGASNGCQHTLPRRARDAACPLNDSRAMAEPSRCPLHYIEATPANPLNPAHNPLGHRSHTSCCASAARAPTHAPPHCTCTATLAAAGWPCSQLHWQPNLAAHTPPAACSHNHRSITTYGSAQLRTTQRSPERCYYHQQTKDMID